MMLNYSFAAMLMRKCCAHDGIEMFERDDHAAACSLIGGWRLVRLFEV